MREEPDAGGGILRKGSIPLGATEPSSNIMLATANDQYPCADGGCKHPPEEHALTPQFLPSLLGCIRFAAS